MPPRRPKQRLDLLLVQRGLATSAVQAQALILAGRVVVDDQRADKPGTPIPTDAEVRIKGERSRYVSRGGLKLERALAEFGLRVSGLICADIGASTGGFTDCLLQAGAAKVYAIDVGYGQLHQRLRTDARVILRERVNARYLSNQDLPEEVDLMAIDVSFISLKNVVPAALARLRSGGVLVALVKPQFEVGRKRVGEGGVVREPAARAESIEGIQSFLRQQGLELLGATDSPVPGPAGNVEALVAARKGD
jgi:23S rRNA (cytidine1920-2'-O)/16S rRNA (cytidine1409-2'-O)-methyltransferase